ncbi:GntR family transcriptional regulator [Virgibacillus sp. NKC19-16]|uniref:GntR family transcriptional regulator n=1 Tax=Virgibacillus salidurans TaxID=2831673 RepID=UPI001F1712CF|nr:GntR family transcriptional regulator [Virgibacillus sp. NKC19-16]UJL45709.1 GntR family transcriptional regulator [Virgibacillus sp. NKC19-16]
MLVKSEPFHIQAYKQIQKNLLENVYSPGENLTETSLATQLGVSRGPVREAIRLLIHEGLLVQKGVHIYVYDPTFEDAEDVYLCREKMEPFGAGLAALNSTDSGKKELVEILDNTELALKNGASNSEIAKLNSAFHKHIVLSSNNKQLIQIMQLILGKSSYTRNVLLGDYTRKDAFTKEHADIVDAIIKGDQEQAEKTMKLHIERDFLKWKEIFTERKANKN